MKNGSGRFFHLDHGQLFEGFWVDNVAKCGTMIDFGRDEAPEPTQFPIPEVGSSHQGPLAKPERDKYSTPQPHPAQPSPAQLNQGTDEVLFSVRVSPGRQVALRKGSSTAPHRGWQQHLLGGQHPQKQAAPHKTGSLGLPCSSNQPVASLQVEVLDPDGVLEEALAMFRKTQEEGD